MTMAEPRDIYFEITLIGAGHSHGQPPAGGTAVAVIAGAVTGIVLIMAGAFQMMPDSASQPQAEGERSDEPVTPEAYALGMLMRGIHL